MIFAWVERELRALIGRLTLLTFGMAAALAALGLVLEGPLTALSIMAGAAVAVLCFVTLVVTYARSMPHKETGKGFSAGAVAIVGCAKLFLLGMVLWWLITSGFIGPLAFLAGFSTMVIALLVEGMHQGRRA